MLEVPAEADSSAKFAGVASPAAVDVVSSPDGPGTGRRDGSAVPVVTNLDDVLSWTPVITAEPRAADLGIEPPDRGQAAGPAERENFVHSQPRAETPVSPATPATPFSPRLTRDVLHFSAPELEKILLNKRDFLQLRCCCSCPEDLDTCSCFMGSWMRDLAHTCIPCACLMLPLGGLCGLCDHHCPTCRQVSSRDPWRGLFEPCPPPRRCGQCTSAKECVAETVGCGCFSFAYVLGIAAAAVVVPAILLANCATCGPCLLCHELLTAKKIDFVWPPEFLHVRVRKEKHLEEGIVRTDFTVKSPWKPVHMHDCCLAWVTAITAGTPRRSKENEPDALPVGTVVRVVVAPEREVIHSTSGMYG